MTSPSDDRPAGLLALLNEAETSPATGKLGRDIDALVKRGERALEVALFRSYKEALEAAQPLLLDVLAGTTNKETEELAADLLARLHHLGIGR